MIADAEKLPARVLVLEPLMRDLATDLESVPAVAEVRMAGLMAAVDLQPALLAEHPSAAEDVVVALRERGVLSRTLLGKAIQLSPTLVISEDELRLLFKTLRSAVEDLEQVGR
jgi:adenosylmethionine-8-amino-7-oxononanoate aminotransferase